MQTSKELSNIIEALTGFQSCMKTLPKSAKGYGYNYTPLDVVIDAIREELVNHGLSFVQMLTTPPVEYGPVVALTTRLMHTSGEWLEDTMIMPVPAVGKANDAQNYGAALTYARRYALTSMLGLASDEDVDAAPRKPDPVQRANKDLFPDQPTMKPTSAMKRKFHALGKEKYGDAWDDKRPALVKGVTKKRTTSSNHLSRDEMSRLIDGMEKIKPVE